MTTPNRLPAAPLTDQRAALRLARSRVLLVDRGRASGARSWAEVDGRMVCEPGDRVRTALVAAEVTAAMALVEMGIDRERAEVLAEEAMDNVAEPNAQRLLAHACRVVWGDPARHWPRRRG